MTTAIRFNCACGNELRAMPKHAGLQLSCPRCGRSTKIPRAGESCQDSALVPPPGPAVGSPFVEALRFGWRATVAHYRFFLPMTSLYWLFVIPLAINCFSDDGDTRLLCALALSVFLPVARFWWWKTSILFVDNGEAKYLDFLKPGGALSCLRQVFTLFLAQFLLLIFLGFACSLLFIPGVIALVACWFYPFCVLDRNAGAFRSFVMSAAMTRGLRVRLLAFIAVLALLHISVVLLPTMFLSNAYAYRKLMMKALVSREYQERFAWDSKKGAGYFAR